MKLLWLTDPHFDSCNGPELDRLIAEAKRADPDAILVGGDVGTSHTFTSNLKDLADGTQTPIHFVLGNHDHYGSSVLETENAAQSLSEAHPLLTWLDTAAPTLIGPTAILGVGGWGDARNGNLDTRIALNDFRKIADLSALYDVRSPLKKDRLHIKLQELGDVSANRLAKQFAALAGRSLAGELEQILVLMHVPPFETCAWHERNAGDPDWSPYFSCEAVGRVLLAFAREHRSCQIQVLAGHVHGEGEVWAAPNLRVRTGKAVYGAPAWQAPIVIRGAV